MKFPWTKAQEAGKSSSSSESGALAENAVTESDSLAKEILDPEKRPVQIDSTASPSGEDPAASHPVVQPLEDATTAGADTHPDERSREATRTLSTASQSTDPGEPGEDDETKYATGLPLHLLTFGLTLSTFVIALDNTIIATAIPRITTVFNSLDDVGWYGSSYLLTTTSLQPSFGKVYTYFNVKWTYMFALTMFEFGSVLCGAAVNSTMLIVGRAVAGAGAAALFSGGMTIVAYSVPLRKRPIYIGLLSSMFGIASVVGPILGGAFTDREYNNSPYSLAIRLTSFRRLVALVFLH